MRRGVQRNYLRQPQARRRRLRNEGEEGADRRNNEVRGLLRLRGQHLQRQEGEREGPRRKQREMREEGFVFPPLRIRGRARAEGLRRGRDVEGKRRLQRRFRQGKGRAPPASAGEILRRRIRRGQSEYLFLRLRQRQLLFGPGNLRGAQARMVDNRGESRDFPRGRRRRQARPSEGPRRVFGSDRALHRNASEEARGDPPLAGAGAMPGRHHRRVQGEIRRGPPGIPRLHPKGGGGGRSPRLRNGGGCRESPNQDDRRFDNG